jgi:hypothetical protein
VGSSVVVAAEGITTQTRCPFTVYTKGRFKSNASTWYMFFCFTLLFQVPSQWYEEELRLLILLIFFTVHNCAHTRAHTMDEWSMRGAVKGHGREGVGCTLLLVLW